MSPSFFARNDDDNDDGGGATTHVGTRQGLVVANNNVSTDHNNAATWDFRFNELVEFKRQNGKKGEKGIQ